MTNVWVVILLTWNIAGVGVGELKAYADPQDCAAIAKEWAQKANTAPVTCEAFELEYVEQILVPAFQRSLWTREGQPITLAWVGR